MSERFGFAPFRDAQEWMKLNKKKDISTAIAGTMLPGIHEAYVVEFQKSLDYTDYIFRSKDNLLHKERVWKENASPKFRMHVLYQIQIVDGFGTHRIDIGHGEYKLIDLKKEAIIKVSDSIRELYTEVKELRGKLAYNKIRWYKELIPSEKSDN